MVQSSISALHHHLFASHRIRADRVSFLPHLVAGVTKYAFSKKAVLPAGRNRRERHHQAGMGVQTIGEGYQAGWRIHVRCAWRRPEAMKSVRGCLDLHTLVWTSGAAFPIGSLERGL